MSEHWKQARISARSARLLLDSGDTVGAVNRAYYAMFDASRAALGRVDPDFQSTKTHVTIIRRFSMHPRTAVHTSPDE